MFPVMKALPLGLDTAGAAEAALLLGLGVHELSMSPESIPVIRRVIRSLSRHEAEEAAARALKCSNAAEAYDIAEALLKKRAPEIFNMQQ